MLRRNPEIYFGGAWVFPGGRVDPEDRDTSTPPPDPDDRDTSTPQPDPDDRDERPQPDPDDRDERPQPDLDDRTVLSRPDLVATARRAAVREAREETGLGLDIASMTWFAHWLPPGFRPRRFATWFFLAPAPDNPVRIDGGEIHGHRWIRPADALAAHARGEMELVIPTWVTLHLLAAHPTPEAAISALGSGEPMFFHTDLRKTEEGLVAIWEGDAGYRLPDHDTPGPRRRLTMAGRDWRIEGL